GNAGKDAELRYTNTGKATARFSVATTDSWKDQSGATQERTVWHNVVAWDKLAEICANYIKKGTKVYIEGRIDNRSYDDKDGVKKYTSEIVVTDMLLLGGNPNSGDRGGNSYSSGGSASPSSSQIPTPEFDQVVPDSDLPF
ncbi:MAG TPA: single-stranded DNA-binding protein, partial [Candidatus Kapabacteria bacterium]|nr:single-stranded DNA-binding protein [Candidatus Kapabacteria bacterium]